eukprot:gene32063-36834_t
MAANWAFHKEILMVVNLGVLWGILLGECSVARMVDEKVVVLWGLRWAVMTEMALADETSAERMAVRKDSQRDSEWAYFWAESWENKMAAKMEILLAESKDKLSELTVVEKMVELWEHAKKDLLLGVQKAAILMAENWVATTESNMVVVMAILSDFERAFLLAIGSVVRWVASMESHSAQLRDLVT